jgi:hypothetical protein
MMMLQIVLPDGTPVRFPAGGVLERELVNVCTDAILAKGVGILQTQAQVEAKIRAGITEAIYALKADTRYVTEK